MIRATVLSMVLAASLAGCGGERPEIPRPELSEAEPLVARVVAEARENVEREPGSATAWGRLGHVLLAHGWEADAARAYRHATDLEPDDGQWWYYLGRSLQEIDPAAAEEALARSIGVDPGYAAAYELDARLLRQLGRPDEAARRLETLVELAPESPVPHWALGEIALAAGRHEEARDRLERAVEMAPGYSEAHRALSRALLSLGERAAAERHARLGERPTRYQPVPDPHWTRVRLAGATRRDFAERGRLLLAGGEFEAAAQQLEVAVSDGEATPRLRRNLGLALVGAGRHSEAVPVLERAVAEADSADLEADERSRILAALGAARAGVGDLEEAERDLRRALEFDPGSVDALAQMALVHHLSGRTGEAIRLLEDSGVDAPELDRLRDALAEELDG